MSPLLLGTTAAAVVLGAEVARKRRAYALPIVAAIALIALRSTWSIARTYASNAAAPHQWDYLCFWLYGRSLALHLDPYRAHSLGSIALPWPVDAEFRREVFAVGVPYPPWSLPLFRPLGMFAEPHGPAPFWYALEFAAVLGTIIVIARWQTFSWQRVAVVAALVTLLPPIVVTAGLAQTIPLALLFLALYVLEIERPRGGVWLAAAATIKPFLLVLFLVPLARRCWQQLGAYGATLAAMSLVGAMLAGPAVFVAYVRENPISRMPGSVLTEDLNATLVAYALRWMHVVPPNGATLPPIVVVLAGCVLLGGIAVARLAVERDAALASGLLLTVALVVYPQSYSHYAVLLAIPLLVLRQHRSFARWSIGYGALVFAVYSLLALDGGRQTLFASLLVGAVCAVACFASRRHAL